MNRRIPPVVSSRKQPKQTRSTNLVAAILEAAIQVLSKEGARRFTTARVAERAGVSVGSIYQYFPNKASILFRLQSDEWKQTINMLEGILGNMEQPPLLRLRNLVHAFIRSECEEAEMRIALHDSAPLYREAPEAKKAKDEGNKIFKNFIREVLPNLSSRDRSLISNLITTTMSKVGKNFSETPRSRTEIKNYADQMADMFCAYIISIQQSSSIDK